MIKFKIVKGDYVGRIVYPFPSAKGFDIPPGQIAVSERLGGYPFFAIPKDFLEDITDLNKPRPKYSIGQKLYIVKFSLFIGEHFPIKSFTPKSMYYNEHKESQDEVYYSEEMGCYPGHYPAVSQGILFETFELAKRAAIDFETIDIKRLQGEIKAHTALVRVLEDSDGLK